MNARIEEVKQNFRCGHTGKNRLIQEAVSFGDGTGLKVGQVVEVLGVSMLTGAAVRPLHTEDVCWVRFSAVNWDEKEVLTPA